MHAIAQYGLGLSIVTSALGAFVLCLLVFRYGFVPADDEAPDERYRRQFATRLGHAAGAVCFAISAGLAAIVLGSPTRVEPPAPVASVTPGELATLRTENQRLGDSVHTLTARLDDAETAMQRLRATSTDAGAKLDRLERIAAAPRPAPPVARPVSTPPRPVVTSAPLSTPREQHRMEIVERENGTDTVSRGAPTPTMDARVLASTPAPEPRVPAPAPLERVPTPPPHLTTAPPSDTPAASIETAAVPPAPIPPPAASAPRAKAAPAPESEIDAAVRGVVRLGDTVYRGLVNAGRGFRRFVEDLQ